MSDGFLGFHLLCFKQEFLLLLVLFALRGIYWEQLVLLAGFY